MYCTKKTGCNVVVIVQSHSRVSISYQLIHRLLIHKSHVIFCLLKWAINGYEWEKNNPSIE